ncbi:major capsid protein [Bartonella sp. DGB2]|uniref:major capsid protein n=2 Tax=Bartonella sp. DGB2 TaxID=3388426 RepID=UPI00399004C9
MDRLQVLSALGLDNISAETGAQEIIGLEVKDDVIRPIERGVLHAQVASVQEKTRSIIIHGFVREALITLDPLQDGSKLSAQEIDKVLLTKAKAAIPALIENMDLIFEIFRFGAMQGVVYDVNGSVLVDWFDVFGIKRPEPIQFNLDDSDTDIASLCSHVIEAMKRACHGAFPTNGSALALCGEAFYDALIQHPQVQAQAIEGGFTYGGITFMDYHGVSDYEGRARFGIPDAIGMKSNECQFIPQGMGGLFYEIFTRNDAVEGAHDSVLEMYTEVFMGDAQTPWIRPRISSNGLFICAQPQMLLRGIGFSKAPETAKAKPPASKNVKGFFKGLGVFETRLCNAPFVDIHDGDNIIKIIPLDRLGAQSNSRLNHD